MRIAFILPMFPVLSETFVLNQITGLIDQGHDVRIFAFSKDHNTKRHEDVEKYGLESRLVIVEAPQSRWKAVLKSLYVLGRNLPRHPRLVSNVFGNAGNGIVETLRLLCCSDSFLKSAPFDVFHCHFGPSGVFAVRLKHLIGSKAKIVVTFHGFDITRYVRENGVRVYQDLFADGDLFLPVTYNWKRKLAEMGCPESRTRVHRMGIDLKKFPRKRRKGNPEQGPRKQATAKILTVGRLMEKKGIEYGIRAVSKLIRKRPEIPFVYSVAGDGPLRNELQALVHSLGCHRNVKMLGWRTQNEIAQLMEDAHIFLAPSVTASDGDQEGLPVVLMEALAKGLVVCSTFHSGIPELIEHGRNGFLAPERDENALCDNLETILDEKIDLEAIREAGYRKIAEEFEIDKLNGRLIGYFASL